MRRFCLNEEAWLLNPVRHLYSHRMSGQNFEERLRLQGSIKKGDININPALILSFKPVAMAHSE